MVSGLTRVAPLPEGRGIVKTGKVMKMICCVSAVVALLLAGLLVGSKSTVRKLQAQLQQAQAERDQSLTELQALERQQAELSDDREEDRVVLGQLWEIVQGDRPKGSVEPGANRGKSYDVSAVKDMIQVSGGDLESVMRQILTPERLDATLKKHASDPAFWVAAASMCDDPSQRLQYLETAAAQFPDSAIAQAALVEAQRIQPQADESTWAAIDRLRQTDPTSSLADHYDAYYRFKEGDSEGALQALAAASEKDRFADNRMELMMSRYDSLVENGCTDGAALALSAFTLPFDHLPMAREVSQQALQEAQDAFAAGQTEGALQTAEYVVRIGRNLSSSGRFLVYDQVGIELQQGALEAQRRFHESVGNQYQVGEIDFQLGAIQGRQAQVNEMVDSFGRVVAGMAEDEVVNYIDSTIMHGEFSTLQGLTPGP